MKNIVLLSDGTGNSAAKRHKTNVWRLYQALDLDDPDRQIAFYNDGVGSQQFLPFKLLGGAFGWGLKRNVIDLYITLCRTYNEGDKIYLFGFSRGAFTVRMLAGLIACCGLAKSEDEGELLQMASRYFIAYRSRYKKGWMHRLWRWVHRLLKRKADPKKPDANSDIPRIEFIGAWDTVDAYGFPVYELSALWDRLIWPLRFVDQKPTKNVRHACHALSIDDERVSFRPLLWDERGVKGDTDEEEAGIEGDENGSDGTREPTRIEQVWFAGVHADVGGGYPRSELALVSLDWMMSKVEVRTKGGSGLHFMPANREEYRQRANWHGVQHDSRSGVRAYYRYSPRNIDRVWKEATKPKRHRSVLKRMQKYIIRLWKGAAKLEEGTEPEADTGPKIHYSVLERLKKNIVPYAPTALPRVYDVIDGQGKKADHYKSYDDRKMETARGFVHRRRWLYVAFVLATLTFAFLPLFLAGYSADKCVGWSCVGALPLRFATCVLPDCAVPWIEVWIDIVQKPWGAAAIVITALTLQQLKTQWFSATRKHAMAAWSKLKHGS